MQSLTRANAMLDIMLKTYSTCVKDSNIADLSPRQMAILLTVYITEAPHTVKLMSKNLNISKPAVTRAVDKLVGLELVKRKPDEKDKRNVLIQRTIKGSVFLRGYGDTLVDAYDTVMQNEQDPLKDPLE